MPLLGLIAGTGAIGPEIDDGSIVYLLAKPLSRLSIVLTKVVVAVAVITVFGAVTVLLAGLVLSGTSDNLAVGYAVGALVAGIAYGTLFLLLAVVTRHAVVVGLLYALIWETLVGSFVPGAQTLSIQQWALAITEKVVGSDARAARHRRRPSASGPRSRCCWSSSSGPPGTPGGGCAASASPATSDAHTHAQRYIPGMSADIMDEFGLRPASITRSWEDGNITRHPQSHYLDFVVNGRGLSEMEWEGLYEQHVTSLNRAWLGEVLVEVDRLLGRASDPDLDVGRCMILLCPIDGDLGCGAVTARVSMDEDTVRWSDWALENGFEPRTPIEGFGRSLTFDRESYERTLLGAYGKVATLPYDELAHRGRRFLWPWQWGWRLPADPR